MIIDLLRTYALRLDPHKLIYLIGRLGKHISRSAPGLYEVLDHDITLELKDTKGKYAIYSKRQTVKFLRDNVIAYQDKAWGDGDIFVDYCCSPGYPVDRYREGHRYHILISLRETKSRGDVQAFQIQRGIEGGFTRATEELQTEIDHRTKRVQLSVIFPGKRPPQSVHIIQQNAQTSDALGPEHFLMLPDGRRQVRWQTIHACLHEAYILRWTW